MWDEVREQAEVELALLRQLLTYHADLLEAVRSREPSRTELTALGGFLQSFYTGIEAIFKRILEGNRPQSPAWRIVA